jgi:flagellar protein FlaI
LPTRLLKKAAEKLSKEAEKEAAEKKAEQPVEEEVPTFEEKKEVRVADIGEALKELEEYAKKELPEEEAKRIAALKKEYETGRAAAGPGGAPPIAAMPKVIDFATLKEEERPKPASPIPELEAVPAAPPLERRGESPRVARGIPSGLGIALPAPVERPRKSLEELETEAGRVKNIPVKAHRIPKQYIKTMAAAWKPPEFAEVNQLYYLIKPFSMANLKWNPEDNRLAYYLVEPHLTVEQRRNLGLVKDIVVDLLDINLFEIKSATSIKDILKQKVDKVIADYGIAMSEHEYQKMLYFMYRDFLGLERIEPLMHDPNIEDISCDGVKLPIYIYHRKFASIPTNISFDDEEDLNRFIIRMAQRTGKHISVADPLLDGALPDGSRVQATFSSHKDIAMHGSTFTIRKFTRDPLTITDLLNFGTLPELMAAYMWLAIEYRRSILIAGGTATGKTSFLNTLSMFIPFEAKIVSIEDTPEIRLPHEHWVQKVVRSGFGREDITGKKMGEITMYDLLRAALRERPDNLVVGEVRGAEAYVLFQGMATGHAGLATIHGDSVDAVMHRLQTPPINLSPGLLQHLNVIVILTKARIKGVEVRRVKEVVEVLGLTKEQEPIINTLFRWNPADDTFEFASDKSYVLQGIIEEKGIEEKDIWEEVQRRTQILKWMKDNGLRYYIDVGKVIQQYYSSPEEVLKNI